MLVCYHHNDLDGKAAAFCVHRFKPKTIPDTADSYHQCTYEDKFDKHTTKDDVFIVDLSISPITYPDFINVCKTARTVTWIDHHESSMDIVKDHKDELQSIKNLTYFVSKCACGAALTYAYLHLPYSDLMKIRHIENEEEYRIAAEYDEQFKTISVTFSKYNKKDVTDSNWYNQRIPIPKWLFHIDDYDCWKKIDKNTEFFTLGCDSNNTAFTIYDRHNDCRKFGHFWNHISDRGFVENLIRTGNNIYDYIHSRYYRELKNTFEWTYKNTTFVCKNGTGNSWCFEHFITKYPAAILFYYDGSCAKWKYSVFSDESSSFNCKEFCEQFGGGGHIHAAGFSTDNLIFTSPKYLNNTTPERTIFLGGTVDDPWREEFIHLAKANSAFNDIKLFNPIVEDWDDDARDNENKVKDNAFINLFVITPKTIGMFSIAEAVEYSHRKHCKVVFVAYDKFNSGFSSDSSNRVEHSLDATGKLIEDNGGIYIKINGNDAPHQLVDHMAKLVNK